MDGHRAFRCEDCGRLWTERPGATHDHANGRMACLGFVVEMEVVPRRGAVGSMSAEHEPVRISTEHEPVRISKVPLRELEAAAEVLRVQYPDAASALDIEAARRRRIGGSLVLPREQFRVTAYEEVLAARTVVGGLEGQLRDAELAHAADAARALSLNFSPLLRALSVHGDHASAVFACRRGSAT